jgi:hypothetical protein
MDKRRTTRFVADQVISVTLLRDPHATLEAKVHNFSDRGLGLLMAVAVPPGTALKIEIDDTMIFGEAVYCRPDKDHHYIGVELNQVLAGLAELGRRLQEFAPESSRVESLYASDHRHTKNR